MKESKEKVFFEVVDWLPCSKDEVKNKTPCMGKTSITLNKNKLVDSVLTVMGHIIIAVCSKEHIIKKMPDNYIFIKKG